MIPVPDAVPMTLGDMRWDQGVGFRNHRCQSSAYQASGDASS